MKRKIYLAAILALLIIAVTALVHANKNADNLADQQVKLQTNQTELHKVNNKLDQVKQEKIEVEDNSKQQIQKLEEDKKNLEQQLQAKAEQKAKLAAAEAEKLAQAAAPVVSAKRVEAATVSGCGDNELANYIYMHESGCRPTITNAEGCVGIGQACPASKLLAVCPDLSYACQNKFFTDYAMQRYGSWQGAYNFWLANKWW